jgi:hypothetical protein
MNKAMIESYLRNLLGVFLALTTTTMANVGVTSPIAFGTGEWLLVANGVWAAAIPTLIRYLNTKDPAFGRIAEGVAMEVSKRLAAEAKAATAAKKASEALARKEALAAKALAAAAKSKKAVPTK